MEEQSRRRQWRLFHHLRIIEHDWLFYSFAFIPFFVISFAVWICLDEAIFALRYRIIIQWSLFPYFRVFPDIWHYFGIALFVVGMILMGVMLLLNRSPKTDSQEDEAKIQWFQIVDQFRQWMNQTPALVIIGVFGLIFLGIAVSFMYYAFLSQLQCSAIGPGIPCFTNLLGIITIESLFLHQIGDVLVALGLILLFFVVIRERSTD